MREHTLPAGQPSLRAGLQSPSLAAAAASPDDGSVVGTVSLARDRITRRQWVQRGGAGLGALAAVALGGCGANSTPPAGGGQTSPLHGQIHFSHDTGATFTAVFKKLASQFQEQNPGVQVVAEPTWDWNNAKYITQAVGGSAADIVWTSETFYSPLYIRDILQPLDAYMSKDGKFKPADYFDTVNTMYKFRGKQAALPIDWGAYVMYYNKTLFQDAGHKPPDENWTWDTFLETAKALTKPPGDPSAFGQYGFETRNHQNPWSPWVWGTGGDLFSQDGLTCTLDQPAAMDGTQYLMDLMFRYKVAPTPAELKQRNFGTNAFGMSGKVGMVFNAIYAVPNYWKVDLFEWDIAPIPKGPKARLTPMVTDGLAMWKGTSAPDAAWAFMRFLVSEDAGKTWVTDGVPGMPANKNAAQLILKDTRPPAHRQVFFDAVKYGRATFTSPYGQNALGALAPLVQPMWDAGAPVKSVMPAAVAAANASIQQDIAADTKK